MRYHIDTDMGVDDGLALLVADRCLDEMCCVSTVFGNVDVRAATRNALLFRRLLGRQDAWRVLEGAARAMDGFICDARHIHGEDGMGGATHGMTVPEGRESLEDALRGAPAAGEVVLIGLGPATNIPELVRWYGREAVARIVLMSGAFHDVGNITPAAEFNAYCDPWALQATIALGIPTTIVPLDVCRKVQLPRALIEDFAQAGGSALARLIAASHAGYMRFYLEKEGVDGCVPHDAVAVLAALSPDGFHGESGVVSVECGQAGRGATRIGPGCSHVTVLTGGRLKWVRDALREVLQ